MEKLPITIRPMGSLDIEEVARVHFESFPTSRTSKLGKSFLRKMYTWYVLYQPGLSFVALQGEEIIGFVTGTIGWGGGHLRFRYTFWHIVWGFLRKPVLLLSPEMFEAWKVYVRGLMPRRKQVQIENNIRYSNTRDIKFALDSIAVHPRARGLKAGQVLVRAFEEAAKTQGATYLALGVECDNRAARRLYENCGWELSQENIINNSAHYTKIVGR